MLPGGPAKRTPKKKRSTSGFKPSAVGRAYAQPKYSPPKYRPTPKQVEVAHAQERAYKSQGKAVKKVAHVQKAQGVGRPTGGPTLVTRKEMAGKVRRHSPEGRARAQERAYKSQGKAVRNAAATQQIAHYLNQDRAGKRQTISAIKAKDPSDISLGDYNISLIRAKQKRAAAEDKRVSKLVGFSPTKRYSYTPEITKHNVMPWKKLSVQEKYKLDPEHAFQEAKGYKTLSAAAGSPGAVSKVGATATGLLEQVDRSSRGINAALLQDVRQFKKHGITGVVGHGSLGKAKRAASHLEDERVSGAKILGETGWKPKGELGKAARAVAGFGLEVGIDPLTYVTGGTTSVARKASIKQAEKAARVARAAERRAGGSRKQARRAGQRARYSKLQEELPTTGRAAERGVQVKFAGRAVPGVTPASVAVKRGARKATPAPVRRQVRKAGQGTRAVLSDIHGGVRGPGKTREQEIQAKTIKREMRATEETGARRSSARAQALQTLTTPEERQLIHDAIENNAIDKLPDAAPIKVPARLRRGRKKTVELANNPDRLKIIARDLRKEWGEGRTALTERGVKVGLVEERPPVQVPKVTADVGAAQRTLGKSRRQLARTEREALEQARPGAMPGRLTPAQTTRANRLASRARDAKAKALKDFADATRNAKKATNPNVAARFRKRASSARGRARQAQAQMDHWNQVAGRETRSTRRVLTPNEPAAAVPGTTWLTPTGRAAPMRTAPDLAKQQVREAEKALTGTVREARAQRSAKRVAEKEAAAQKLAPKGYVPRVPASRVERVGTGATLDDLLGRTTVRGRIGSKKPSGPQTRKRSGLGQVRMDIIRQRAADGDQAAQDYLKRQATAEQLPLVHEALGRAVAKTQGQAEANEKLVAMGTPVKVGEKTVLGEGERVYRRDGPNLTELSPDSPQGASELRRIESGKATGEYVKLPRAVAEDILFPGQRLKGGKAGEAWDRLWGKWKGFTLATPGYLVRNALSDAFASYQEQGAGRLATNYVRGQRVLGDMRKRERAYQWFQDEHPGTEKTININGHDVPLKTLALEAEAAGAIRQGRVAELREQAQSGRKTKHGAAGETVWRRTVSHVEDSARLATYIGYRRRGMNPQQAATKVSNVHFDYGDLTQTEKQMRRAMPFYTYTSRNLPRQAALIARRPGTLATLEKARQTGREYADLPKDFVEQLNPYDAKQLGVPVKFGGKTYVLSFGAGFSDLNSVTPANLNVAGDPAGFAKSLAALPVTTVTNRGIELLGPWKMLGELAFNYSTFYRDQISKEGNKYVAAPQPIAKLADSLSAKGAKQLGLVQELNKQTGKKRWAWDAKLDYAIRGAMPGLAGAALKQSYEPKIPRAISLAGLSGIRLTHYDPVTAAADRLYSARETTQGKITDLNEQGIYESNATPEYRKLLASRSTIEKQLDEINRKRLKFYKGRPTSGGSSTSKSTIKVPGLKGPALKTPALKTP